MTAYDARTYQQNSNLQGGVHVICIQPWFFSIGRLHFGHGLELANILPEKQHHFSNHDFSWARAVTQQYCQVSTESCYKYTSTLHTLLICFTGIAKVQITQDQEQESNSKTPSQTGEADHRRTNQQHIKI